MAQKLTWTPYGAGWRVEVSAAITLWADPVATVLGAKPKRGTKWRAGASHWDAPTRTITGYGRDMRGQEFPNAKAAMAAAVASYQEAAQ